MLLEHRLKCKYILLMINQFENSSWPIYNIQSGDYVFGSVSLSLCLLICLCQQHYSKSYEGIAMKCYGGVQSGKGTND